MKRFSIYIALAITFFINNKVYAETVATPTVINFNESPNGTYSFTVGDTNYNSMLDLGTSIYPRFTTGETFIFDTNSRNELDTNILTGTPQLTQDLANCLSALSNKNYTAKDMRIVLYVLNQVKNKGYDPFEQFDFNSFFNAKKTNRLDIEQTLNMFLKLSNIMDNINNLKTQNAALITQVYSANPILLNLLSQQMTLIAENNPNNILKINELQNQMDKEFFTTKGGLQLLNSPLIQENVKSGALIIQEMQGSFPDGTSNIIKATNILSTYFVDPSVVSHKDLPPIQKSDTNSVNSVINSSITTSNVINNRTHSTTDLGMASGDFFDTRGLWLQGSMSSGDQKSSKREPGYKFNQYGLTIGGDIGDETTLGIAFSFFNNDVSNKTTNDTKDKINIYINSIYGTLPINSSFYLSAQGAYGITNIKKIRATGDLANNKATAKTKGSLASGMLNLNYIYTINDHTLLLPTIGISNNYAAVNGYSETGNGLNRSVDKITSTRTSAILGIELKQTIAKNSMTIIPEIHANLNYVFTGKNSNTNINIISGINLITPSEKISQILYNFGTSVKILSSSMIDLKAGYDLALAKKFISNTGIITFRINF